MHVFSSVVLRIEMFFIWRIFAAEIWRWAGADLNCRPTDFQSVALPTELPAQVMWSNYTSTFLNVKA